MLVISLRKSEIASCLAMTEKVLRATSYEQATEKRPEAKPKDDLSALTFHLSPFSYELPAILRLRSIKRDRFAPLAMTKKDRPCVTQRVLVISYQLRTTSYWLPPFSFELLTFSYQLHATSYKLPAKSVRGRMHQISSYN